MKFGIDIPTTVLDTERLDTINKNNIWAKTIHKELKNMRGGFQLLEHNEQLYVVSKDISYRIMLDVKCDLKRKVRLLADIHCREDSPHI